MKLSYVAKVYLIGFLMLGIPAFYLVFLAERAETFGHTSLSRGEGNNYFVFRSSRAIHLSSSLLPHRIVQRDGQILKIVTIMNRTLPTIFYFPASSGEKVLWRMYFQTADDGGGDGGAGSGDGGEPATTSA